ncbi:MAG: hypothetical protein WCB19_02295 [Thermoplasmata archaeon]
MKKHRARKPYDSPADPLQHRLALFSAPRAGKVARSIVRSLTDAGCLGKGAKEIAAEARVPLRTVYRSLDRLTEAGVVKPVLGKFVLAQILGDITTDPSAILGFQNIQFTVSEWQMEPAPPCRTAFRWTLGDGGDAGSKEVAEGVWEGRRVKMTFYPDRGSLEVIIAAVVPIPLLKAPELLGWLNAMLGLGRGESTELTRVEANADHEVFVLERNYLELRRIGEFAQVLYQKASALRHEMRLYRPTDADGNRLPLERAVEILTEGSPVRQLLRLAEKEAEILRLQAQLASKVEPEGTAKVRQPATPSEMREAGFG